MSSPDEKQERTTGFARYEIRRENPFGRKSLRSVFAAVSMNATRFFLLEYEWRDGLFKSVNASVLIRSADRSADLRLSFSTAAPCTFWIYAHGHFWPAIGAPPSSCCCCNSKGIVQLAPRNVAGLPKSHLPSEVRFVGGSFQTAKDRIHDIDQPPPIHGPAPILQTRSGGDVVHVFRANVTNKQFERRRRMHLTEWMQLSTFI